MKDHNCEEHIEINKWYEDDFISSPIEEVHKCSICGRIKYHYAYGDILIENWESKESNGELDEN